MVDEYYDTTDFDDSTFGDESPQSTDPDVSVDSDFEDDFEVVQGQI